MNPLLNQSNRVVLILALLLTLSFLSGCGTNKDQDEFSNRANSESIQEALRSKAYASWDEKFKIGYGSGENLPTVDFESSESYISANRGDNYAPDGINLDKWRKQISSPWAEIPDDKFEYLCKIWFDWFQEPKSAGDDIGERFQSIKDNLKQMSLTLYAVDQVTLIQDNRKTISYPKQDKPSELIVCRAEVVFETNFGSFNRSYVYLTAKYVLKDGKAVFSFPNFSSREIAK
jgi:hypothetical protein